MRRTTLLNRSLALALGFGIQIVAVFGPQQTFAAQSNAHPAPATPLEWPGFVVDVTLSDKAKAKLISSKEALRVFGYYSGTPNQDALKKHLYEEGEVGLGNFDVEFPIGGSARIDKVTVKRDALAQTDGNTPIVLINVVSARKSSKNNLLDCGIFEDRLDKIQAGHIPIACKLIGE
jgi:hypothetical protein